MLKLKKIQDALTVIHVKKSSLLTEKKKYIFLLIIVLLIALIFILFHITEEKPRTTPQGLIINEYVTSNLNTWRDENWNSPDWIELYNCSNQSIWLGNIYISDDAENPEKDLLPDYILGPGEYFLVSASGEKNNNYPEYSVSFKLGFDDLHIVLSNDTTIFDIQEVEQLPTDISKGRLLSGQWGYFAAPTPMSENATSDSSIKYINPIYENQGKVVITEYMTNDLHYFGDESHSANDWIELHNTSLYSINLNTMYLSDDISYRNKYRLPDYNIKPDEYLIIYLSVPDNSQNPFSANFSLGGDDTHIFLTSQSGYDIDVIDVMHLPEGVSAGRNQGGYFGYYSVPTPGEKNSDNISFTIDAVTETIPASSVFINEYMPNNKYGIQDTYGKSSDWIELFNPTNNAVSLDGFGLSDDISNPMKWIFPENTIIPAKGYMIVFASGNDGLINGEYHTNFSLCNEDSLILLTNPNGFIADSIAIEQLPGNVSKGRIYNGEISYFSKPTPGSTNNTYPDSSLDLSLDIVIDSLYINEIAASEINLSRESVNLAEYIELYNSGIEAIALNGYSISDSSGNTVTFDDISIEPGEYLILITKGYEKLSVQTIIADNIRINSAGETIILKNNNEQIIDCLKTGYLLGDYSYGRSVYNKNRQVFYNEKTPGNKNSDKEFTSACNKPTFSANGGIVLQDEIRLEINAHDGETIKYTLNGDEPTIYSRTYTEPLTISKNTIVRAIAFSDEKLPSSIASSTYIFDKTHDIPIVCISADNSGLFSNNYGIYAYGNSSVFPDSNANYYWNEERSISFEYYEPDGSLALAFNAGIRIFGGASRVYPQKSFSIHLRDEYGLDELYYPFFGESDVKAFKSFILRCGGQDVKTKLKDYFVSKCAIEDGNQDGMRGQPVALYINGAYWGLYNLREKINEDYISYHYNLDASDINIITLNGSAVHGNNSDWEALESFCEQNDFSIQENYDRLSEWIDVENFTDYIIFQTFFSNTDVGNIKFWRDEAKTTKWRVLFYDLDYTLRNWDDINMIERLYEGTFSHKWFCTQVHVFSALIQNEGYRDYLLKRYAYYLREVFTDEYLENGINEIANEMANEMVYQTERWPQYGTYEEWQENVQVFKNIALSQVELTIEHLRDYFDIDDAKMKELLLRDTH